MLSTLVRRLRGALGMGVLWGAAGAFVGGMIELVLNILPGSDLFLGVDMWPAALAIPGFLAGVSFSFVLAITERRRSFDQLAIPRTAGWGALGGLGLALLFGLPPIGIVVVALTSAGSAAGTLALARRARSSEPPALPRG